MTTTTMQQETLSAMLISRWEATGQKLAALAEEFPESHYEAKPAGGVRTFGDVLRHAAFWNQFVADSARGRQADDATNELPKTKYPTKAKILEALKATTADAAKALKERSGGWEPETAEMVLTFIEHNCEHYGQLVVYARLQGIIPPASRAQ